MMMIGLIGCGNKDLWDTNYTYDTAVIQLSNNESVEVEIKQWTDYEDGDQLQIKIGDITYLVHSSKAILMSKAPN